MFALLYGFKNTSRYESDDVPWETSLLGIYKSPEDAEVAWEHFKKDLWAIFGNDKAEALRDIDTDHYVLSVEVGVDLWRKGKTPGTVELEADMDRIFGNDDL